MIQSVLESLSSRIKAIEEARREEQRAEHQRQMQRSERSFYLTMAIYGLVIVAALSATVTASIVGR
ncbi:MAG TPA: hypothetical protein VMQ81_06315 [Acidimicrobiia bacterium]|nr:hypothetical protein [Acidimicrobiia bacterium]